MTERNTEESVAHRSKLIDQIRQELEGPSGGENEVLLRTDSPHKRYIIGVLYPREIDGGGGVELEDDEDIGVTVGDSDEPDDSPLAAMLQRAPASAGMTFATVADSTIKIQVSAARYELGQAVSQEGEIASKRFTRIPLQEESYTHVDSGDASLCLQLFNKLGELRIRWRVIGDQRVSTISIVNAKTMNPDSQISSEDCLFQVKMKVTCEQGGFVEPPYPQVALDSEEEELRLRYRKRRAWAVGHASSVTWSGDTPDSVPDSIELDSMPVTDVYDFNSGMHNEASFDPRVLSPKEIAKSYDATSLKIALSNFVDDFAHWSKRQSHADVDVVHRRAFSVIMDKLKVQKARMRHGIAVLCDGNSPERFHAFSLANKAMLDQMEATSKKSGKPFSAEDVTWYPFQLAFQLLSIPGAIGDVPDSGRELVDLLWFPTGGGKTEAYLLLAAFTIILRKLRFKESGGGTAVISRYTLRLLTAQQFERTSTLICALELMRSKGDIPGTEPITIGLWIGGGETSSPNKLREADYQLRKMLDEEHPVNRFMLLSCPWCGTDLVPRSRSEDRTDYGLDITSTDFIFNCTSRDCPFHERIPVQVVDEVIYSSPPTVLLGTIDKFARLPWESRSRVLFGLGTSKRAPDLIIQDELHLISGPLGTIAALYEAGIDVLLKHAGSTPKIVAATATIRGAEDQAKRLYGRKVCLFPASGPNAEDSYFMTEERPGDENRVGIPRQYIGVMGQGHTPVTSTVRIMAAMLNGGGQVWDEDDYWTLVAYHNSRRELGKTQTLARDDVPARIKVICSNSESRRKCERVEELSGNVATHRVPSVLKAIELKRSSGAAVDVLACTNMISVGVDVGRLNMMMILGQPKTSAEYIQASSRVGRSKESAGLVVTSFSPTKPRDRSHYESFRRFHESIYRWVEPTSVTPQADPAQVRALHAVIIMVIRLALLPNDDEAGSFDSNDPIVKSLIEQVLGRLKLAVGPDDLVQLEDGVLGIVEWWSDASSKNLRYQAAPQFRGLMRYFGTEENPPSRQTLNSMRHVDGEAGTYVRGEARRK